MVSLPPLMLVTQYVAFHHRDKFRGLQIGNTFSINIATVIGLNINFDVLRKLLVNDLAFDVHSVDEPVDIAILCDLLDQKSHHAG